MAMFVRWGAVHGTPLVLVKRTTDTLERAGQQLHEYPHQVGATCENPTPLGVGVSTIDLVDLAPARAGSRRAGGKKRCESHPRARTRGEPPKTVLVTNRFKASRPHARGATLKNSGYIVTTVLAPARAGSRPVKQHVININNPRARTRGKPPLPDSELIHYLALAPARAGSHCCQVMN